MTPRDKNPYLMEDGEAEKLLNQTPGTEIVNRPPVSAGQPPDILDRYQGGVVSSIGLQTDTANSQLAGKNPVYRLMPATIAGNPAQNAAVQSVAAQSGGSGGVLKLNIGLVMPLEFAVDGSPITKTPGEFDVTWVSEESGTVFAAPTNTVGGFDAAFGTAGVNVSPATTVVSITGGPASADPAWAFYCGSSQTGFAADPVGWTALSGHTTSNPLMAIALVSGAATTTVSQTTAAVTGSFATSMLYFAGPVPSFVQTAFASSGGVGTPVSIPLASTGTGNALLVVCRATLIPASGAGTIRTGYTFTDTQSLTPYQVSNQWEDFSATGGAGTQLDVFILPNTVAGPETVNVSVYVPFDPVFGFATVSATITIFEITTTALLNGIPRFRHLPQIDLNTGILGILQPFYGGTGSNLQFTGGTHQVVMQETTGAGFTVRQLAVTDLSTATIGTGTKIFLATTVTGTGTVGVLNASPAFTGTVGLPIATLTGKITNYNSIATVANGVPSELAQVNNTTAAANIAATTAYAVPAAGVGMYRISFYVAVKTVGTTSTLPDIILKWTDQDNSTVQTSPSFVSAAPTGNSLTTQFSGEYIVSAKASTNIQYQTGSVTAYASTGTPMVYVVRIRVEALG